MLRKVCSLALLTVIFQYYLLVCHTNNNLTKLYWKSLWLTANGFISHLLPDRGDILKEAPAFKHVLSSWRHVKGICEQAVSIRLPSSVKYNSRLCLLIFESVVKQEIQHVLLSNRLIYTITWLIFQRGFIYTNTL